MTKARSSIETILKDPVVETLLQHSNLTKAQFETVLLDQLGSDLADKHLTRDEMSALRTQRAKTSRGAFNRTLSQGRTNVTRSIHTILLLGYARVLDSPGLMQFVEASESLRANMARIRESSESDQTVYDSLVATLLTDLEEATDTLYGKRDT